MHKKILQKIGIFASHSLNIPMATYSPFNGEEDLEFTVFYLSLGQATKLYGKVAELGQKAVIENLDTISQPEKLVKTLNLLNIKARSIQFNDSGAGYILTLDTYAKNAIEVLVESNLKSPISVETQDIDSFTF